MKLDALAADTTLTPEQRTKAAIESQMVDLVGNIKEIDSATAATAVEFLQRIYNDGYFDWQDAKGERKAMLLARKTQLASAIDKEGVRAERKAAEAEGMTAFGFARKMMLSMSSFHEVMSYLFGQDNKAMLDIVDRERNSSNAYHDAVNALDQKISNFFTSLAGGVLDGEKMRYQMAQDTIDGGVAGKMSQLEAIQAMLMWAQADGKRHMEGKKDDNGKVTSAWSYDQAWVDKVHGQMTSEALQLMNFISNEYAQEYELLNDLHRERYGVDLPRHQHYAPVTVVPHELKPDAGTIVDPATGAEMHGAVTHPGFMRNRSRNAINEPDFRDALSTFISHRNQVEYWRSMYDVAKEVEALATDSSFLNVIRAKGGEEAAQVFRQWSSIISKGGVSNISANFEVNRWYSRILNRAASAAILGRISTLLVQSTQLGAAMVQIPTTAYIYRFSKMLSGNLEFGSALKSDFIKRRMATKSPLGKTGCNGA